ncbi:Uu.00g015410.m01.CDS01 [Anthostomella pinea]|uniref:Uu.00g015410.m01.CDS01 n=1 Tax=Anthostomella pinea TaxID=933095 RepID=A0AAI8VYJ6_9PEZI|nr:Uu.00g015410.m01.CDS01 [Anthostomella pinea]
MAPFRIHSVRIPQTDNASPLTLAKKHGLARLKDKLSAFYARKPQAYAVARPCSPPITACTIMPGVPNNSCQTSDAASGIMSDITNHSDDDKDLVTPSTVVPRVPHNSRRASDAANEFEIISSSH